MLPSRCIQLPCKNIDVSKVKRTGIGQGTCGRACRRSSQWTPPNGSCTEYSNRDHDRFFEVVVVHDLVRCRGEGKGKVVALLLAGRRNTATLIAINAYVTNGTIRVR